MSRDRPVISLAVMYHPSRKHLLPALADRCLPLRARLVEDPEPDSMPSPLRTAKRAWAAIAPGATHHAVLQDDVIPIADFARHLQTAVTQQPHHVIALHVMWNAPINAYFARRAAVLGSPWAHLSLHEWVPCQGLVMPAATATRLAAYLRTFPDAEKADDELVKRYCKREGLAVLATLPHLVEHLAVPSLAGNDADGVRTGAVPLGEAALPPGHFAVPAGPDSDPPEFSLRMRRSECRIRRLPEDARTDHGWVPDEPWRRVVDRVGASEEEVLADLETAAARHQFPGGILLRSVAAELWAYAWLMGRDGSRAGGVDLASTRSSLRERAIHTLITSGLFESHAVALTPDLLEAYAQLALRGVRQGISSAARQSGDQPR